MSGEVAPLPLPWAFSIPARARARAPCREGSTSTGPAPALPGSTRWCSALSQAGVQQRLTSNSGTAATLEGWGIGAYWMGVTGPWSLDTVAKLDYFNWTPTAGAPPVPGVPSDFFFTNYTAAGNLNYRIPLGWTTSFIEPTVGALYVRTDADSGHSQSRDWRPAAFAGRCAPGNHLGVVERRERARNGQAPCLQQRTCLGNRY